MDEKEKEIERLQKELFNEYQQLQIAKINAAVQQSVFNSGKHMLPPSYMTPFPQMVNPTFTWMMPPVPIRNSEIDVTACCCDYSMANLSNEKPKEEKPKAKEKTKPEEKQAKNFLENLIETVSDFFWEYII